MTIVRHCDLAGPPTFCNRGARQFCARHNINWQSFRENGIDADVLLQLDDAMATELVNRARRREEKGTT